MRFHLVVILKIQLLTSMVKVNESKTVPLHTVKRVISHNLIMAILKHRVATILLVHGFFPQEPPEELIKLGGDFNRMKIDLEHWAWPWIFSHNLN